MAHNADEITGLLARLRNREQEAESELFEKVYSELHRIATHYGKQERAGHTLSPTALIHEAYVRLFQQLDRDWQNRDHFFGIAAQVMRRVMVDYARGHLAGKRGSQYQHLPLEQELFASPERSPEVLALDEALTRLEKLDPRQSRVVELRFFGGLTEDETAKTLGITVRTVQREWSMAKAWLHGELRRG